MRLTPSYSSQFLNDYQAFPKEIVNRWIVPGDEAKTNVPALLSPLHPLIAREGNAAAYDYYNYTQYRVASASHVRLKVIGFGYNYKFNQKLSNPFFIKEINFGFQIQNVGLLYSDRRRLRGQDPEFYNLSLIHI